MTDTSTTKKLNIPYIETPRSSCRPEKISTLLEARMKTFLRVHRRKRQRQKGVAAHGR